MKRDLRRAGQVCSQNRDGRSTLLATGLVSTNGPNPTERPKNRPLKVAPATLSCPVDIPSVPWIGPFGKVAVCAVEAVQRCQDAACRDAEDRTIAFVVPATRRPIERPISTTNQRTWIGAICAIKGVGASSEFPPL